MRKPKYKLYYLDSDMGCGLRAYRTLREAEREELKEVGTWNFRGIRLATKEEITWIKAMGGHVPDIDTMNDPSNA